MQLGLLYLDRNFYLNMMLKVVGRIKKEITIIRRGYFRKLLMNTLSKNQKKINRFLMSFKECLMTKLTINSKTKKMLKKKVKNQRNRQSHKVIAHNLWNTLKKLRKSKIYEKDYLNNYTYISKWEQNSIKELNQPFKKLKV